MKIYLDRNFSKFVKKEKIPNDSLIKANDGLIYANLKGDLIKQTVGRKNEGSLGGYRTIIAFKREDKAFFLYGFPKNKLDNITQEDEENLLKYSHLLFSFSEDDLRQLVQEKELMELSYEI